MKSNLSLRLLPRIQDIFFISIFIAVLFLGQRMLNMDGDLPRHLLLGQQIAQTRAVPTIEPFIYPYENKPYVSHEWLADLILFLVYKVAGLAGIVVLSATLLASTFTYLYSISVRRYNLRIPILFLFILGAGITSTHWITRPHLFSMLLLAIWVVRVDLLARGENVPYWQFLVLMIIWSNLHGEFIAGILVLVAYVAGWSWDFIFNRENSDVRIGKKLWLSLLLSLIACVITPSGTESWFSLLSFVNNNYLMSRMAESNAPNFQLPEMRALLGFIAFSIFLLGVKKDSISTGQSFLLTGFTMMSLLAIRNVHLYGIVASFVLVETMRNAKKPSLIEHIENALQNIERKIDGILWPVCTVIILGTLVVTNTTSQRFYQFSPLFFPIDAVTWLKKNPQEGHMFNDFTWGGYISLHLWPQQSPFIDSIADGTVEAKTQGQITRQYETIITLSDSWQDIFTQYTINWVIIQPQSELAKVLMSTYNWTTLYRDNTTIILKR